MAFGKRLLDRLASDGTSRVVAGLPVVPHYGDTFSGEVGFGEDLILADDPEADLVDEAVWGSSVRSLEASFGADDFGVEQSTILGLVKSGNEGLNAMTAAFGKASGEWVTKDPSAFADFLNDLTALQLRWASAKSALGGVGGIVSGAISAGTAGLYSGSSGQAIYNGLYKALHQGGEGSPIHKGDFNDLAERLRKVTTFDWKPNAGTPGGALSTLTGMIPGGGGVIPSIPGGLSGIIPDWMKGGLPSLPDPTGGFLKWWREHEHVIVLGITLIGGLMFAGAIVGLFKGAPIAAKVVAAKYLPVVAA
jgi:hypothetical protein